MSIVFLYSGLFGLKEGQIHFHLGENNEYMTCAFSE